MTVQYLLIEASGLSDTHGSTWLINQFPQITEVNSCVELLGKNLSYHTASVHPAVMGIPGGTKTGKIVNGISCRKYSEFSPEEMHDTV